MTRLAFSLLALVASLGWAAPGAHGPNGEHLDAPSAVTPNGLARLADGSVNVPMLAQRRLSIRTKAVHEEDAAVTVQLSGRVAMDPNAGGRVQTVVGGKVLPGPKGLPVAGQAVRKGEVLALVAHHAEPIAVANQQALLAEIRSHRKLAEARVVRLESLEGSVPRKDIEAARAEATSLAERERAVGRSVSARETLTAPIAGVIARADALAGQVVEPRDLLFEVVDPSQALVEATTTDLQLGSQLAQATLSGVPGVRLQFLGAARTLRDGVLPLSFRVTSDGAALPLAIGQPVTVLAARRETVRGFVLPAQALARSPANEPIVWIKSGAERFIPQPVQYRPLDAGTVVVTQGLGADNRVVIEGAALIAQIR